MKTLIETLKNETKDLKISYLQKVEEWSKKNFDIMCERRRYDSEDWCRVLGVQPEVKNQGTSSEFIGFPKGFFNTRLSRTYDRMKTEASRISSKGLESYVQGELKKASEHYENSIIKLADRIVKKGLDLDRITLSTSFLDPNISTTITDGSKTVKAFTIIASGEVQRPHYRYLVK